MLILMLVMMVVAVLPAHAQTLASRVARLGDGAVTFHFASRPGVCGDGEHFFRTGRHSYYGTFSEEYRERACVEGPVQVRITTRDAEVTRVQTYVGALRSRDGTDLGVVSAAEAASYLLGIAQRGRSNASEKAILGAVLADSATVWPGLLAIAKDDENLTKGTRQDAMFWLSRYASAAIAGHPNDPFSDDESDSPDDDLKRHAVFVLSQLPHGDGVSELLKVARSNVSTSVRSQAFFWLGQSGDPRALALFESVLKS
ncbi:MAG TPA: HEAT repeat domain-containing protein [Gemmatimonadaceae bacterium]|nr:HEAT repeat domain-containing protein [Gemmatimonadaceae bacterium]